MAKRSIILIGMKYSGKSVTAVPLAKKLGCKLVDTDVVLVSYLKEKGYSSIKQFTDSNGFEPLRGLESNVLNKIHLAHKDEQIVLSTGGGLPINRENTGYCLHNRSILKKMGPIFYLSPAEKLEDAASILTRRQLASPTPESRPHPQGLQLNTYEELYPIVLEELQFRHPYYNDLANCNVFLNLPPRSIAHRIVQTLAKHSSSE